MKKEMRMWMRTAQCQHKMNESYRRQHHPSSENPPSVTKKSNIDRITMKSDSSSNNNNNGNSSSNNNKKKKVIIVCTNGAFLKDHATGLWLEECSAPYYVFQDAGLEVELASPAGGCIPIDAASMRGDFFVASAKKFLHDPEAVDKLHHPVKLADIDFSSSSSADEQVDAIYLAAGHGTCVDFVDAPDLKHAIETMYAAGKIVAAVCHAPIAFVQCVDAATGKPFVAGKTLTAFSDAEEEAVQLTDVVPFMLEAKLKELGAIYEKGNDWSSKVCVDGNLITGQNPQSSEECAKVVLDKLVPAPTTPPNKKNKPAELPPTPRNSMVAGAGGGDDDAEETAEEGGADVVFC
jgi:putative intracellular protease/amidase